MFGQLKALIPYDFFLWGYLRDCEYQNPVLQMLDELRQNIVREARTIDQDLIERVKHDFFARLKHVIAADGRQLKCTHWFQK